METWRDLVCLGLIEQELIKRQFHVKFDVPTRFRKAGEIECVSAEFPELKLFLTSKYLSQTLLVYRVPLLLLILYVIISQLALLTGVHAKDQVAPVVIF